MRKSDVEPGQCSVPNWMSYVALPEDVRPGQRFMFKGVRYIVLSKERGTVLIEREDKRCRFTYGAEALMRINGVRWIKEKGGY